MDPAGESLLTHFEASFSIGTTSTTVQSGLHMSVSPDNGSGARMSYLRFEDQDKGVNVFDFATGPGNDVVKIVIDGKKQASGRTWENYYRFDPEAAGSGNTVPPVSKLLFRESGTANPGNAGNGFLVDGVTLASS